jgi:uncharacterized protein YhaN
VRITDLKVDGFGRWRDFELDGFDDGLNVLYGPNETGKTTLLQFIRSMLYGFSPARRQRYLPPFHGGLPGGSIALIDEKGAHYRVSRHADLDHSSIEGRLSISDASGHLHGPERLEALRHGIDEATYNNVFAIGLRELQELSTLGDTRAAESLYHLTTGLDRVSLSEVMRDLGGSRRALLDENTAQGELLERFEHKDALSRELAGLDNLNANWERLVRRRDRVDADLEELDLEVSTLQQRTRAIEAALKVRGPWQSRGELEEKLAALGEVPELPDNAIEHLDALNTGIARRRQRMTQLDSRRRQLAAEIRSLAINDTLWQHGPRIEALADQSEWIASLQQQIGRNEEEILELETRLEASQARLGLETTSGRVNWAPVGGSLLKGLREPARAMRDARRTLEDTKTHRDEAQETAQELEASLRRELTGRAEEDLTTALQKVGARVSQLRRRVQLDERGAQLNRHQVELEEDYQELLEGQLTPLWLIIALGAVFVAGVVLILIGLLMPGAAGTLGTLLALLGAGGSLAAAITKVLTDRSAAQRLEQCEKQLHMVKLQIQQAREEREALDAQIPPGAGPLTVRLQEAKEELAELEALVPRDGQRQIAQREVEHLEQSVEEAQEAYRIARRRWSQALVAAGLPKNLAPRQLRAWSESQSQQGDLINRLDQRRRELADQQRALATLRTRIDQLMEDVGIQPAPGQIVQRLQQLKRALLDQQRQTVKRDTLRGKASGIRRRQLKLRRSVRRLTQRRRQWLSELDAPDEPSLRIRAERFGRVTQLREQIQRVELEIQTALHGMSTEEDVQQELRQGDELTLEGRWEEMSHRLQEIDQRRQKLYEIRGELKQQLKTISSDRGPLEKRFELGQAKHRFQKVAQRWRVLAAMHGLLYAVRKEYEKKRQPEALREASLYLDALTAGRYSRVWTPLDEDVLKIDDLHGRCLPVEALSRGTREQLFLSLRLALTACYARRGIRLPMVMDDVLVNFDTDRVTRAVEVLREFVRQGHQAIVFTCHEHVAQVFAAQRVALRQLPVSDDTIPEQRPVTVQPTIEIQSAPAPAPKRSRPERVEPAPVVEVQPPRPVSPVTIFQPAEVMARPLLQAEKLPRAEKLAEPPQVTYLEVEQPGGISAEATPQPNYGFSRFWTGEGAEEFRGEFRERVRHASTTGSKGSKKKSTTKRKDAEKLQEEDPEEKSQSRKRRRFDTAQSPASGSAALDRAGFVEDTPAADAETSDKAPAPAIEQEDAAGWIDYLADAAAEEVVETKGPDAAGGVPADQESISDVEDDEDEYEYEYEYEYEDDDELDDEESDNETSSNKTSSSAEKSKARDDEDDALVERSPVDAAASPAASTPNSIADVDTDEVDEDDDEEDEEYADEETDEYEEYEYEEVDEEDEEAADDEIDGELDDDEEEDSEIDEDDNEEYEYEEEEDEESVVAEGDEEALEDDDYEYEYDDDDEEEDDEEEDEDTARAA